MPGSFVEKFDDHPVHFIGLFDVEGVVGYFI